MKFDEERWKVLSGMLIASLLKLSQFKNRIKSLTAIKVNYSPPISGRGEKVRQQRERNAAKT